MSTHDYSAIEPKTRAFLEALDAQGGPPLYTLSPRDARSVLDNAQSGARVTKLSVDQVTEVRYLGTVHDFMMLNAFTDDPAPRAAVAQATAYLREAFGQPGARSQR